MEKDLTFKEENLREEALNMAIAMAILTVCAEKNKGIRGKRSKTPSLHFISLYLVL